MLTQSSIWLQIRCSKLWFLASGLAMVSCTWMESGEASVLLRHYGLPLFLLGAGALFMQRILRLRDMAVRLAPGLPALVLFITLVGTGGMVSHGAEFARMAADFWHADLMNATNRRPFLPAIADILPPWPTPYGVVWYAMFSALFLLAWQHLGIRGMSALPRFSLLTAGIIAYLLVLPGYTEVLTFLVALLCWRANLTSAEKCVCAALMIGGHEVAGAFAIAFLAIESDEQERQAWLIVASFLFACYGAGFLASAGTGLWHAIDVAQRPGEHAGMRAIQFDLLYPWRCVFGIAMAYKVAWLLLPPGLRAGPRVRLHAACVLAALPLILLANDTSRVVQFGTLSMLAVAAEIWKRLARSARIAMVGSLLAIPSLCVTSNGIPQWGKGFYAIYLLLAHRAGLVIGVTAL